MIEGKISEIHGWAAKEPGIHVEPWSYKPRPLGNNDVEVKIHFCGICGSDLHMIKSEWGKATYPAIVGHEIVGHVISKGKDVKHLNEGDLVGIGAQCYSCQRSDCKQCSRGTDPHCPHSVNTYNARYEDGALSQGGYADAVRVDSNYAFKFPSTLDPAHVAPLMCAGTTVFTPMLRQGVKKGDRVGVIGIGGLGHLAIQYANALGAEVVAFSHSPNKHELCTKLGASIFVDTSKKEEVDAVRHTLDYLYITSNSKANQYAEFVTWMDIGGTITLLALPEGDIRFKPAELILSEAYFTGSLVGSLETIKKTLEFSAEHNVLPIIEMFPMNKVNEALQHMEDGKARFRIVLENPKA